MKLQIPQIIALASQAGFSGPDLATAVSVALAESGGDPQAYNPERRAGTPQGYGSFGLWQIYLKAHPEYKGMNLLDPAANASAAFSIYTAAGNSFRPWSTFKNNTYLAQLDAVNAAIAPASQDTVATDAGATSGDSTSADTTDPTGGGFTPSGTDMLGMAAVGALALWAAFKVFG
jgi:hypothetical protein